MIRRAVVLTTVAVLAPVAILAACDRSKPAETAEVAVTRAPAEEAPADPNLLTPDGIGMIRIGQSVGEVQALSGMSDTPINDPSGCNIFHPSRAPVGLVVMAEAGHVTRISLHEGATVKTARGFGVGSEGSAIKAAYGGGVIVQPAKYEPAPAQDLYVWARGGSTQYVADPEARGVRYEVGADGKVAAVHAGGPSIQLAESCG
ncbi:hypothetical protein [Brevundimonas goettingensis]|uniref:Lipoprotein n=1 Tax=Brevundimonas goettingensis TaxID=2774190 RepID=A0A975GX47_9CAUL|nr:hypothetical protein [Brevundimonas goettingensis]QTC92558.1 hypothetical protein IFJ75_06720 [Brevundimonas goettingensis]